VKHVVEVNYRTDLSWLQAKHFRELVLGVNTAIAKFALNDVQRGQQSGSLTSRRVQVHPLRHFFANRL
jgi:hypothetical protein